MKNEAIVASAVSHLDADFAYEGADVAYVYQEGPAGAWYGASVSDLAKTGSTLEILGRKYSTAELVEAYRARDNAGEGFVDCGCRPTDVLIWQAETTSEPSVVGRGADVLLISEGWAVRL